MFPPLKKKQWRLKPSSQQLLVVALLLVALLASACRSFLDVNIYLKPDGTGTVELALNFDGATLTEFPELLDLIEIDDLGPGGWEANRGKNELLVSKSFFRESQIQPLLEEVSPSVFRVESKRTRTNGKRRISLNGSLDMVGLKQSLFGKSDLDITQLPPEASTLRISITLGDAEDSSVKTFSVPLTSNKRIEFEHSHTLGRDQNSIWRWVGIAALSLLGLVLLVNFLGWLYQRRVKNQGLKSSAKPKQL